MNAAMMITARIFVERLYISSGHNFIGHHGQPPGAHRIIECQQIHCVAGRGIVGDRFFDHKENFKGQITFFASEVFEKVCDGLGLTGQPPGVARRNVITAGVDLNLLIGEEFVLQEIRFLGVEECRPCYWMDQALAPGAEAALRGRGGLRARILTDGLLRVGG
jgi:MOSC domain-containing protein YiiM